MLGMLLKVFSLDNVAIQRRVSRQRKVALIVPVRVVPGGIPA
jgi:hypothetical protein